MLIFFGFAFGKLFVKPLAFVFTRSARKHAFQLPIGARFEFADLVLAFNHQRQRRRLHTTDRSQMEAPRL